VKEEKKREEILSHVSISESREKDYTPSLDICTCLFR
jgi:hypothetical protein